MKNNGKFLTNLNVMKQERGSITVLVLASLMFFLLVFVSLYMGKGDEITSQDKEIEKIQESYNMSNDEIDNLYEKIKDANTSNTTETNSILNSNTTIQNGTVDNNNAVINTNTIRANDTINAVTVD